jgi:hypothetical protein
MTAPAYRPEVIDPAELPDAAIRAVIEAWMATGMMTARGDIDAYVCDIVREQIKAAES